MTPVIIIRTNQYSPLKSDGVIKQNHLDQSATKKTYFIINRNMFYKSISYKACIILNFCV